MVEHGIDAGPSRVQNARRESAGKPVGVQASAVVVCQEGRGRRVQRESGGADQGLVWTGVLVRALLADVRDQRLIDS